MTAYGQGSLSLFVTHPGGMKAEYLLTDELRVGRQPDCHVRVASPYLSRMHFIVRRQGDAYVVETPHEQTQAPNSARRKILATYVNSQRVVGTRPLASGDRISTSENPGPDQPVFVIGPTVSPTPADQLPAPGGGGGKLLIAGCVVIVIIALVAIVIGVVSS